MKKIALKLSKKNTPETKGFSDFFAKTGSAEKKKIIKIVVQKANQDQKKLVQRFNRKFAQV